MAWEGLVCAWADRDGIRVGGEVTFVAIFRDSLFFTCLNKKEKSGVETQSDHQ